MYIPFVFRMFLLFSYEKCIIYLEEARLLIAVVVVVAVSVKIRCTMYTTL